MVRPASRWAPRPHSGVAGFPWNQWQLCYGISGNFRVEQVAALAWNTQPLELVSLIILFWSYRGNYYTKKLLVGHLRLFHAGRRNIPARRGEPYDDRGVYHRVVL